MPRSQVRVVIYTNYNQAITEALPCFSFDDKGSQVLFVDSWNQLLFSATERLPPSLIILRINLLDGKITDLVLEIRRLWPSTILIVYSGALPSLPRDCAVDFVLAPSGDFRGHHSASAHLVLGKLIEVACSVNTGNRDRLLRCFRMLIGFLG